LWRVFCLIYTRKFGKLDVCTYICIVNLENAILSSKFGSQTQKAGLNVLYTAWWLKTVLSRELKALGLTHEQFNVLRILKGKHPEQMCVRDIARRMIEKSSNVPRIIDRLEIKKLVNRSTSSVDKRETVIRLTSDGINILEIANKKVDELFNEAIEINEEDATQLNQLLEKMREKE
jgi:DNA-binding MarR family transcriptional regulator